MYFIFFLTSCFSKISPCCYIHCYRSYKQTNSSVACFFHMISTAVTFGELQSLFSVFEYIHDKREKKEVYHCHVLPGQKSQMSIDWQEHFRIYILLLASTGLHWDKLPREHCAVAPWEILGKMGQVSAKKHLRHAKGDTLTSLTRSLLTKASSLYLLTIISSRLTPSS